MTIRNPDLAAIKAELDRCRAILDRVELAVADLLRRLG